MEGGFLFAGRDSGDDVACEAADKEGLFGIEIERDDDVSHNRSKGIPVVEAKRSETMTLAAKVTCLRESHFFLM